MWKPIASVLAYILEPGPERDVAVDVLAAAPLIDDLRQSSQARRTYWVADTEGRVSKPNNLGISRVAQASMRYQRDINNLWSMYERLFEQPECEGTGEDRDCDLVWRVPGSLPREWQIEPLTTALTVIDEKLDFMARHDLIGLDHVDVYRADEPPVRQVAVGEVTEKALSVATYGGVGVVAAAQDDIRLYVQKPKYTPWRRFRKEMTSPKMLSRRHWLLRAGTTLGAVAATGMRTRAEKKEDERLEKLRDDINGAAALINYEGQEAYNMLMEGSPDRLIERIPSPDFFASGAVYEPLIRIPGLDTSPEIRSTFSAVRQSAADYRAAVDEELGDLTPQQQELFRRGLVSYEVREAGRRQRRARIGDLFLEAGAVGLAAGAVIGTGEVMMISQMNPDDKSKPNILGW